MPQHDLSTFELVSPLPLEALAELRPVVVDALDIKESVWPPSGALRRLAAAGVDNLSQWLIVGDRYRDLSGWCEFEQKMEYHHEDLVLLVRKSDHEAAVSALLATQE